MKKILPVVVLLLGIAVVVGVYFFVVKAPKKTSTSEGEDLSALIEVPLDERPLASLTPSSDGHWLKMRISKMGIDGAGSVDYKLLYNLPDGRSQGVPGRITLKGQEVIERDLLLGSESSGKFRYDEGVTTGTFTLLFRNEDRKLLAKFTSDFHLQAGDKKITSTDGNFSFLLDKPTDEYFVVMETFGFPGQPPSEVLSGPYGVFSSSKKPVSGMVNLSGNVYWWSGGEWLNLTASASDDVGIFFGSSQ